MDSSTATTLAIASLSIVLDICMYDITPTLATDIVVIAAKSTGSFLAIDMFFNISQTFRMIDHFNHTTVGKNHADCARSKLFRLANDDVWNCFT